MSILSFQSSVAVRHVGNSAAVFALRHLGFKDWAVLPTPLPNHAAYDSYDTMRQGSDKLRLIHAQTEYLHPSFYIDAVRIGS